MKASRLQHGENPRPSSKCCALHDHRFPHRPCCHEGVSAKGPALSACLQRTGAALAGLPAGHKGRPCQPACRAQAGGGSTHKAKPQEDVRCCAGPHCRRAPKCSLSPQHTPRHPPRGRTPLVQHTPRHPRRGSLRHPSTLPGIHVEEIPSSYTASAVANWHACGEQPVP